MTKKSNNQFKIFNFIIFSVTVIGLVKPVYSQFPVSDSSFHPYIVNYWVSGSICGLGVSPISWEYHSHRTKKRLLLQKCRR